MNAGNQIVTLVEIDIPFCVLDYGQTPCQAQLGVTGTNKCHNTCATCQDLPAYSPAPMTLRFARPQEELLQYGPLIPILDKVSTTPASVNLASMDKNSSGFGQRESVTLLMNDVLHSDLFVDKYRLERQTGAARVSTGEIEYDFVNSGLTAIVGANLSSLAVTRASATATRVNASGAVEVVAANIARSDFDPVTLEPLGILREGPRTNSIRNNTAQGAVVGSPGTAPTNWVMPIPGLTQTIVGTGSAAGVDYVDVRFNGNTGAAFGNIAFEPTTGIAAVNGQIWTSSCYLALVGGSLSNVTGLRVRGALFSSAPAYLGEIVSNPPDLSGSLGSTMRRFQTAGPTLASTAWVQPYVQATWSVGAAVDFTLRFGLPQMELGGFASSVIKTTGATATRNSENFLDSGIADWFNPVEGTVSMEVSSEGLATNSWPAAFSIDNGSSGERISTYHNADGGIYQLVTHGSVHQVETFSGVKVPINTVFRFATRYRANDFAISANGQAVGVDSSGTVPTVNRLSLGGGDYEWYGHIRRFRYFPRGLTNAESALESARIGSVPFSIAYDPYYSGTFFGKFLARNPYHAGYEVRIYEGEIGDAIGDMRVRHYVIDHVDGPKDGQVQVVCKDLFSKVEARKAIAPLQSRGESKFDFLAADGTLTLNPVGIGDIEYPTSGFVAVGDECMSFTRSPGSDLLTLTLRGALNTVADDHKAEDLVQLVVNFVALSPHEIAKQLLVDYAGMVDGVDFVFADWSAKATEIVDLYTARITKPTPVADLIGELQQQAGFTLWPDVRDGLIKFSALRAAAPTVTVTDRGWIKGGSLTLSRQTQNRITQIWIHYGQIKPNGDLSDRANYYSTLIEDDPLAEGPTQYDGIIVREIFSRWIPQFGRTPAQRTGQRLLAMYRDAPLQADFTLYASRAGEIAYDRYFNLQVQEVQDEFGAPTSSVMAPTMIENGEDYINIRGQGIKFPSAPPPGGSEVVIYIENDALDLNLRSIFDSISRTFTAPIRFVVDPGVIVGSTSISSPAITTGSWPVGTTLTLENNGRIQGRAGDGGVAGYHIQDGAAAPTPATPGTNGGPALQALVPLLVKNAGGELWGGAGGGGGAGGMTLYVEFMIKAPNGGGGAGTISGSGVADNFTLTTGGTASQNGTSTAGGAAGVKGGCISIHGASQAFMNEEFNSRNLVGAAGDGGGPGLDGVAGTNAGTDAAAVDAVLGGSGLYVEAFAGTGAAGGIKGAYIVGNANVTWVSNGDRRGSVS